MMLAGLHPLAHDRAERWPWSGSWRYPVGAAGDFAAACDGAPAYRLSRGVAAQGQGTGHQGDDLSNGCAGGIVRAAAGGLVLKAATSGENSGYGLHVVLGHRLPDGRLVYTVYAHLAPGSIRVRPGSYVAAGAPLGRVGMTGRATSPHLHFEVRLPSDPEQRWEKAPVVEPLAFVGERLARPLAPGAWDTPYLSWAEEIAVIAPRDSTTMGLGRSEWWRMLAASTRSRLETLPEDPDSLRAALREAHVLDGRTSIEGPLTWREVADDLARAKHAGLRLGHSPVAGKRRRADCRREFGFVDPARDLHALGKLKGRAPTVSLACLALADCLGDPPSPRTAPRSRARELTAARASETEPLPSPTKR